MPIPSLKSFLFPSTFFHLSFIYVSLAIPAGDDSGKGSITTGTGKRSLAAFVPHPGTVITSPQSHKAVQRLGALLRGLRSSSEVLQSQQVSQMCWRNPSREVPGPPGHVSLISHPALGSEPIPSQEPARPGWMHSLGMTTSRYY